MRGRRPALAAALAVVVVALAAAGGAFAYWLDHRGVQHGRVQTVASPVVRMARGGPAHVAIVVMENKDYGEVIGSRSAPYIDSLARRYALATSMYATSHPSLPNYLALTGGSTFGISSDCTDCSVRARNLASELQAAGLSWRAYMEGLPHPCFRGAWAGDYGKKHDPFVYYLDVARDPAWCANVVPLDRLAADELAGRLPRLIWITPNLCHDMHDCSVARGDRFLARLLPPLLARLGPGGVLFLTWDEGTTNDGCCRLASGGHIATVVAGPGARAGARLAAPVDQYSILQAVEDLLGLPRLRGAACVCTPTLAPLLRVHLPGSPGR